MTRHVEVSRRARPARFGDVKLGILSDVHGNLVALDAVLADGRAADVEEWWVLGDLVAIGPEPVATVERLADLANAVAISGNTERYVLTGDRPPPSAADVRADPSLLTLFAAVESSFSWTRGALAAHGLLPWIAGLAGHVETELPDGSRILGVHATPQRDDGPGISPHRSDAELDADLRGAGADIIVGGHTHQPTDRMIGRMRVLNGGSVSNPITDDLRASYLIIHADRDGYEVEHRRVEYDREEFLRRVWESGHPGAAYIASFQLGEQVRYRAEGIERSASSAPASTDVAR